jgi:putative ABC transport system ATP-binding protein
MEHVGPTKKELGEPVIILEHVSKEYPIVGRDTSVVALRDIHLAEGAGAEFGPIRRGEFFMLRGPSGGGKTTLLNILGTLDKPTGGSVSILGTRVTARSTDTELSALRLRKIGFVFQTFNLLATMSAFENVELPMTVLGKLGQVERKAKTRRLLELVGLQDRMGHLPSELSGGEQQRVTIARALANDPELLLLDEPTGDLDTKNTIEVMNLLLQLNVELRTTCVMVTHNPDVECYADRIVYVQDGKAVRQALNTVQSKLEFTSYLAYLNAVEERAKQREEETRLTTAPLLTITGEDCGEGPKKRKHKGEKKSKDT